MKNSKTVVICLVCLLAGFIFTAEAKTSDGLVAEVYQDSIELGVIPEDMNDILGPVIITNKGTADLKVLKSN